MSREGNSKKNLERRVSAIEDALRSLGVGGSEASSTANPRRQAVSPAGSRVQLPAVVEESRDEC
jgi:hypothetical protein